MAGQDREKGSHLSGMMGELEENPHAFGFFQALRMIECLHPASPGFGRSSRPGDDPIRLGQEPSMTFESASLSAFEARGEGAPPKLTVRLLGLLGPNGPLPLHLTEYSQQRNLWNHDPTFSRFLDIFNNRMLGLFYRAWANNEPTVSFDRPRRDRFPDYVGALFGIGMEGLRNRDALPDLAKLHFCGRLGLQTRNPEGLEAMLRGYFTLPAEVEEFVGEWVELPEREIFRLGADVGNGLLGESIIFGSEVWNSQHKFRILLGPMGYEDYLSFLPDRERVGQLVALVRNFMGDELEWDLLLILKREEVPAFCLDGRRHLGWSTWLGDRPGVEDANDLVFNAFAYVMNTLNRGVDK